VRVLAPVPLDSEPTMSTAVDLDLQIRAARARHHQAEHDLAVLLARMAEDKLFYELGYSSIKHYGERALDLTARQVRDLVNIGRRLPDLPVLADALKAGRLGWTKARELLRVATSENEADWVARAVEVT